MSYRVTLVLWAAVVAVGIVQSARAADAPRRARCRCRAGAPHPPASQPAKKPPVDFRKLKELMPAELGGVKRSNNEGEKISARRNGRHARRARSIERRSRRENDPQIYLEIVDYAATPEMGNVMTAWQTMGVDRESDNGYERTTKIKEQPAYETYQNEGKSGKSSSGSRGGST